MSTRLRNIHDDYPYDENDIIRYVKKNKKLYNTIKMCKWIDEYDYRNLKSYNNPYDNIDYIINKCEEVISDFFDESETEITLTHTNYLTKKELLSVSFTTLIEKSQITILNIEKLILNLIRKMNFQCKITYINGVCIFIDENNSYSKFFWDELDRRNKLL